MINEEEMINEEDNQEPRSTHSSHSMFESMMGDPVTEENHLEEVEIAVEVEEKKEDPIPVFSPYQQLENAMYTQDNEAIEDLLDKHRFFDEAQDLLSLATILGLPGCMDSLFFQYNTLNVTPELLVSALLEFKSGTLLKWGEIFKAGGLENDALKEALEKFYYHGIPLEPIFPEPITIVYHGKMDALTCIFEHCVEDRARAKLFRNKFPKEHSCFNQVEFTSLEILFKDFGRYVKQLKNYQNFENNLLTCVFDFYSMNTQLSPIGMTVCYDMGSCLDFVNELISSLMMTPAMSSVRRQSTIHSRGPISNLPPLLLLSSVPSFASNISSLSSTPPSVTPMTTAPEEYSKAQPAGCCTIL
jgi:hypothetical protein